MIKSCLIYQVNLSSEYMYDLHSKMVLNTTNLFNINVYFKYISCLLRDFFFIKCLCLINIISIRMKLKIGCDPASRLHSN